MGGDLAAALTVSYAIGGTATNNNDYQIIPTSITFRANQATVTRSIIPIPLVEGPETVTLTLSSSRSY